MNVVEILKKAKERIATPERWCRWNLALNRLGFRVAPDRQDACVFCTQGAISAVAPCTDTMAVALGLMRRALPIGWKSVPSFNDSLSTTHADIMALFDRAIAAAQASE